MGRFAILVISLSALATAAFNLPSGRESAPVAVAESHFAVPAGTGR